MAVPDDLRARAWAWLAADPDPDTRDELDRLLDATDAGDPVAEAELVDAFAADLRFGTAGLRARLGPGPNRMNLAVITRTAHALAGWIRGLDGGAARGVVVAHDARTGSAAFAERVATVLAAAGVRVHLLEGPQPTPLGAFAVVHLGAAAGVVVTASHNPAADNGCKVYDARGRQIVAPDDGLIAEAMAAAPPACDVLHAHPLDPDISRPGADLVEAYVARACGHACAPDARDVVLAHTALHGVGAALSARVLAAAGFAPAVEVAAQEAPDPTFPTVAFPNPEEPGALDLGLATAASAGADLLLAHDPDADRLGAAIPGRTPDAPWRVLTGDEIGAVLAHHLLARGHRPDRAVVASTVVSSSLLARQAAAAGVRHAETLTGFKWLSRCTDEGEHLVFAYEEALGFGVDDRVRDKDGIAAGVLLAEAAAVEKAHGRSLHDVLDDLAVAHGLHRTAQVSWRAAGAEGIASLRAAVQRFRSEPPAALVGRPVTEVQDLAGPSRPAHLPASDVVIVRADGARLVVRPSGTEPKLKCYLEVVVPVADRASLPAAHAEADALLDALAAEAAARLAPPA